MLFILPQKWTQLKSIVQTFGAHWEAVEKRKSLFAVSRIFFSDFKIILVLVKIFHNITWSGYRNNRWMSILLYLDIIGHTEWRCD